MQSTDDYVGLVPSWNADKAKFIAMLRAILDPLTANQAATYKLLDDLSINTAVGVQLDQIGLWLGRPRQLSVVLPPYYFSFNTANLGFNQGVWKGPFDPTTNIVSLPDDLYRVVLKTKALSNQWDGTFYGMYPILDAFQAGTGVALTIQDNMDMTMTVGYAGATPPSLLYAAIIQLGFVPPQPMGVSFIYNLT